MSPQGSDKKNRDPALADLLGRKGAAKKGAPRAAPGQGADKTGDDALAEALGGRGKEGAPQDDGPEDAGSAGGASGAQGMAAASGDDGQPEDDVPEGDAAAGSDAASDASGVAADAEGDATADDHARGPDDKASDGGAGSATPEHGAPEGDQESDAGEGAAVAAGDPPEREDGGGSRGEGSDEGDGQALSEDDVPLQDRDEDTGPEGPTSGEHHGLHIKETTELPSGVRLRERSGGSISAGERVATAVKRPKMPAEPAARASTGAPLEDEGFLRRAARREEKAARQQARDEARRMRDEAKSMLAAARKREKAQVALEAHMEKVGLAGADLGYDPDRPITRVPELAPGMEEVSFRVINEDRAFIRMAFDTERNCYLYQVIEPRLTPNEEKIKAFLRDTLIRTLDGRRAHDVDWSEYLRQAVQEAIVDHDILVDHVSTERILYYLVRDFLGFGPIDVLMHDDQLEDISCDGPDIPIYVFHRQHESIRTNIRFDEDLEIDSFVIRLAQRSGKHISIADPLLDATLPDGSRLQATLSREVTSRGSSFTIRKFREDPFTPPDLIDYGTVTTPMCAYFWFMMEEGRSLVYAGGTASGKTTSLNACCQFIPPEKKIVSIEDTREINLLHENWIAGVTRSGFGGENIAGKRAGSIDMYRLLEAALRQRPEYLLVGEVRGPEALTLFQAMATGHAVYSTMHADSAKSAVYRLENPPINVPRMMLQTLDTIAIQSQVRVGEKMERRVREVVEIIGFDPDTDDLLTNTVFYWDSATDRHVFTGHSGVFDQIQDKKGWSDDRFQEEWERRMLVLEWLRKREHHFRDFAQTIQDYYQRPEKVMARIEEDGFTLDRAVAAGSHAGDATSLYPGAQASGEPPADALAEEPADEDAGADPDEGAYVPPWKQGAAAAGRTQGGGGDATDGGAPATGKDEADHGAQ